MHTLIDTKVLHSPMGNHTCSHRMIYHVYITYTPLQSMARYICMCSTAECTQLADLPCYLLQVQTICLQQRPQFLQWQVCVLPGCELKWKWAVPTRCQVKGLHTRCYEMLVCTCYEVQVTGGTHFTLCPQPLWLYTLYTVQHNTLGQGSWVLYSAG